MASFESASPGARSPRRPSILLTGFEPFGGAADNPSGALARAFDGRRIGGARVHGLELPCTFGASAERLREAIARHRPRTVLALGLAPSRHGFSVERVAINLDDARIADNAGAQPRDTPVVDGAPAAYFARLPVKAIVAALRARGLAAELSNSAGGYVCNHVFFALLHALRRRPSTRAGFMHLGADLAPAALEQGVTLALEVAIADGGPVAGVSAGID